ncbi:MAG: DUF1634 domain-containing protein [Candidatus Xenobia bacterium]
MPVESSTRLHETVGRMLQAGLVAACLLMLFGLGAAIAHGHVTDLALSLHQFPAAMRAGLPEAWITLGLLILVATPVLRVLALIVIFLIERDPKFAFVAVLVALFLTAAVILGHA